MDISPETAEQLLNTSNKNRKLDKSRVNYYASQMLLGKWALNGESIIISSSGKLLNGHHRLNSVIKSGVTIKAVLVNGVPDDSFDTIDQGKNRTNGDVFHILGIENARDKASIVSAYFIIQKMSNIGYHDAAKTPVHSLIDFYNSNSELVDNACYTSEAISKKIKYSQARLGGMYIFLSQYGDVKEFFSLINQPDNIPYKHPCNILRDSLRNVRAISSENHKFFTYFVMAWNHYVDKNEISHLKYFDKSQLPKPKFKNK